jgi:hypothetical protein
MRFLAGVILLTGCFFHEEDDIYVPVPLPDLSVALPDLSGPGDDGGSTPATLGSGRARPADSAPIHVLAGGSVTVPNGEFAFTVTANGAGGYRVAWVDTAGANLRYHGSIFVHGSFSDVTSTGMNYATASGERLDFESRPGAGTLGYVDFVASTDPITVDVLAGAQNSILYYTDGGGFMQTVSSPATFTSP